MEIIFISNFKNTQDDFRLAPMEVASRLFGRDITDSGKRDGKDGQAIRSEKKLRIRNYELGIKI